MTRAFVRFCLALACLAPLALGPAAAQDDPAPLRPAAQFAVVDLWLDAGAVTCASWQIEFATETGRVQLVGIEGGLGAWATPPYHDPAALHGGRVIVAGLSTAPELPAGRVRVARLQLRVEQGAPPQYVAKLQAASDPDGTRIDAAVSIEQGD